MVNSDNSFLYNLGSILDQQFLTGDNKLRTLDVQDNGQTQRYGKLGDFANKFDQSAQRSYTEEGFIRTDYFNPRPKELDILMQDPDITVVVKKRAFASLAENYRPDMMDKDERLFYKATKVLFQNKANQIANFEKLSKITQVSTQIGRVDDALLPVIFGITDTLTQLPGAAADIPGLGGLTGAQSSLNDALSGFKNITDRVREIVAFSQPNRYTTWLTNVNNSFRTNFGEGSGTIEFTNISSLSTTTSLKFAEGNFNITFNDPYELMLVTMQDIEQAIADATNKFYNNSFLQLGISSLDDTISLSKNQLNQARISRGVPPIRFIVNPDTFLGSRVVALVDGIGFQIPFNGNATGVSAIDPSGLIGSSELGNNGLNANEQNIFGNIIGSLYTQMSLVANTRRAANYQNTDPKGPNLNYVRKRLRLHYANKLIIQPMDNVHIYIGSKKKIDDKIVGGLTSNFTGLGFVQGINNIVQDIRDQFNVLQGYSLEKSIYVGSDFPTWLWQILRNQFVSDENGVHVFGGIVDQASSSYSDGVFTVRANGSDNAGYFNYGIVNIKPSVDVFNGPLYDPLTPFKIDFDSTTGVQKNQVPDLLDENIQLFDSAFVKYKNGLLIGTVPTHINYNTQDVDVLKNNTTQRVFYDPEGFIYRWKEGIATLVLFGDSYEENPTTNQSTPAITADPFAGQDIMNVLSLLISGEPYNFATFYKSAIQFDNFKRDPITNEDASSSYFRGLQQSLKSRNLIYGNFVPFKLMTMDDQSFTKILNSQINATHFDSELQDLLQQRASFADKLAFLTKNTTPSSLSSDAQSNDVTAYLKGLDSQIDAKIQAINVELNQANKPVVIVGDDISFQPDLAGLNQGSETRLDDNQRRDLRRKLALITKRLLWKVRANEDINLLIVDDTYDKDYDIQAFSKQFTNPELYKSEYVTIAEKIKNVAALLDLEVFCNTQGHIEVRNHKYNRMPSSVFYKMLRMKDQMGVQVFPQFLEDLFVNQLEQLYNQIEVLEDEIRLYCLALNATTDSACISIISNQSQRLNISNYVLNLGFTFLSDENSGKITNSAFFMQLQAQPDVLLSSVQTALSDINTQTNISAFDIATRAALVQSTVMPPATLNNPTQFSNLATIDNVSSASTRKNNIVNRLFTKTGQTFNFNSIVLSVNQTTSSDVLHIVTEIGTRLSARQRAVKSAANALKNLQEGISLNNNSNSDDLFGNKLLNPSLYDAKEIPQMFEHMIEDESYDDLGVKSGQRYVLKNHDVISYSLSENRPSYSSIEVTGRLGDLFIQNNELPQGLSVFQQGNALVTAAAVDYDLWRMYGVSQPQSIDAPYLTDPNTQCAPFAVALLNKARKQIIGGNIDIVGNEYQQPGEVIYLENRDLLFYIDGVTHNFSYGRSFTTSLNVSYGHNAGEYIPTMLDVIGKVLYANKDITHYTNKRQGTAFSQEYVGTIIGNTAVNDLLGLQNGSLLTDTNDDIINGTFGDSNRAMLQRIIGYAGNILATGSDTMIPKLELRIFFNSANSNFGAVSSYASNLASSVQDYLLGSSSLQNGGNANPLGNTSSPDSTPNLKNFQSQISVFSVNSDANTTGEYRYPSSKAFYLAREALERQGSGLNSSDNQLKIDQVIYTFVVDCWVTFTNPNNK